MTIMMMMIGGRARETLSGVIQLKVGDIFHFCLYTCVDVCKSFVL